MPIAVSGAEQTIPAVFEQMVCAHGPRTALAGEGWRPSYNVLNATANRLAHAIVARGGAPGDRVAILMEHDAPAVAAVVAVMKAGRIVVVLNSTHPPARLRELIADSEPVLVMTDASLHDLAASACGRSCAVVRFEDQIGHGPGHNPPIASSPEQVAALQFTSGSTGRAKAVMSTHRGLRRNSMIHTEAMQYRTEDQIPLLGSLSSNQGMTMVLNALLNGATLHPFPVFVRGLAGLAEWMALHAVTVYYSTASIFRNFMKTLDPGFVFSGVRSVGLGSESATSDDFKLFQAHFPDDCGFVHALSSTETCYIAWSRRMRRDVVPEGRLPIGVESKGQQALILDGDGNMVAAGEVGEIVVRSRYLAAGYWRNPELTAQRFSADLDGHGTRLFRTGDLGRFNAAGMLEFRGRRDDRVSIGGNSIELAEVETALRRVGDVRSVVVEAIARPSGEPRLVGFVAMDNASSWSSSRLRLALRAALPSHMIPSDFEMLAELPLTPTGKVDREKLRHGYRRQRQQQSHPPKTETESLLAGIWAEVFELGDIGGDEDFFFLGGDSLMAAVVAARVHGAFGVQLDLAKFADHPTLTGLALVIDDLRARGPDDEPPLTPAGRTEPLPLSFSQARIWNFSRTPTGSAASTMARIYRIIGPLDPTLLGDCMDDLARRHDILRTTFAQHDGRPMQIVDPSTPLPRLRYIDLIGADNPNSSADVICKTEAGHVFDLSRGPLLRFHLLRLRESEYWLLRVSSHIISDNSSWVLYFDELTRLYEAKMRGEAAPGPEPTLLQYGDYAVWHRKVMSRERPAYRRSVSWWKQNLSGAPSSLGLPFVRPQQVSNVTPADGMMRWGVERQVAHRLNALSSQYGATDMMVRLAAFAALLAVEAHAADVTVSIYSSARNRLPLQKLIGDFSNILTLRFRQDPTKSFVDWLAIVREQVLGADANSAIPYDELCDELRWEGVQPPYLQVFFHVSLAGRVIEFAGLKLGWLNRVRQSFQVGFSVIFEGQEGEHGCEALFDPRIYDPAGVRVFVERYKRLLDAVSRHPEKTLDHLLIMSDLAAAYARARALHGAGRLAEAQESYRQILKAQPDHCDSLHMLGVVRHQCGDCEDAVRHIDAALEINPELAAAHANRGIALHRLRRFDEAVASYDRAIAFAPDDASAFYNRGNALQALKRFGDAIASYDGAIALKADYAGAIYNRGNALLALQQFDEALASYDKAIALKPDPGALNNRGVVLRKLRRLDEAVASFDRATALAPDDASTFYNRGAALYELERFEEALANYDRALALAPGYAGGFLSRARALQALKRFDEAVVSYDRAIALKPDYTEAFSGRVVALRELHRIGTSFTINS